MKTFMTIMFLGMAVVWSNLAMAEQMRIVSNNDGKVLEFSAPKPVEPTNELLVDFDPPKDLPGVVIWPSVAEKLLKGETVIVPDSKTTTITGIVPEITFRTTPQYEVRLEKNKFVFTLMAVGENYDKLKIKLSLVLTSVVVIFMSSFLGGIFVKEKKIIPALLLYGVTLYACAYVSIGIGYYDNHDAIKTIVAILSSVFAVLLVVLISLIVLTRSIYLPKFNVSILVAYAAMGALCANSLISVLVGLDNNVGYQIMAVFFVILLLGFTVYGLNVRKKALQN